jgi:hypothetical protein
MKTYTYSEARQNLAALLEEASRSGEVRIRGHDGRSFAVRPTKTKRSPLDIDGIETDLSGDEIVAVVREMRRRPR